MQSVQVSDLWPAPLRDAVWRSPHREPARSALAHWPERHHHAENWSQAALRGSIALRNGSTLAGDGLQRLLELLQHTAPRGAKRLRAPRQLAAHQALLQVREACEPASLAAWITQLAQAAQAAHARISHPGRLTHALGLLGDAHTAHWLGRDLGRWPFRRHGLDWRGGVQALVSLAQSGCEAAATHWLQHWASTARSLPLRQACASALGWLAVGPHSSPGARASLSPDFIWRASDHWPQADPTSALPERLAELEAAMCAVRRWTWQDACDWWADDELGASCQQLVWCAWQHCGKQLHRHTAGLWPGRLQVQGFGVPRLQNGVWRLVGHDGQPLHLADFANLEFSVLHPRQLDEALLQTWLHWASQQAQLQPIEQLNRRTFFSGVVSWWQHDKAPCGPCTHGDALVIVDADDRLT